LPSATPWEAYSPFRRSSRAIFEAGESLNLLALLVEAEIPAA